MTGDPDGPRSLDPEDELAYEVCVGLLNEVVGVHSARLWDAEHASEPDPGRIADIRRGMTHYVAVRERLDPYDSGDVARVSAECAAVVRAFHQS